MQHDNAPVLSIVAVTWNAKRYVQEFLASVADATTLPAEIVVVDNDSSDGTPEWIAAAHPEVRLIRSPVNTGFACGTNIGLAAARGRYIAPVNSDVVLHPGCLDELARAMELPENRDVGLIGPQMLNAAGGVERSTMRFPTLGNAVCRALGIDRAPLLSRLAGGQLMADFGHDHERDVEVLNGWFWLVRREALDSVGTLDERFFMYGEDIDWCRRFRRKGWRVRFCPRAKALHYGAASSNAAPVRFYVEMQRADLQYWAKHHGFASSCAYLAIVCAHHLLRMAGHYAFGCLRWKRFAEQAGKARRSQAALGRLLDPRNLTESL